MARIDISNSWGYGLDMSGYDEAGWGAMWADNLVGTLYAGANTIFFDAYGYESFDGMGVSYYLYADRHTIIVDDIYYYQGSTPVLTAEGLNILTTVPALNSDAWIVRWNQGDDDIYGNDYADIIKGGYGNDLILGYGGADDLYGGEGHDTIGGGAGNDWISGGYGDDDIHGGLGNDVLYGGAGRDAFVFDTKPHRSANRDTIKDFRVVDDTIWLDNAVFTKAGADGTLKAAAFHANLTGKAHDRSDRVIYEKDTGKLFYDPDGTGSAASVHFATLAKKLALTNKDFLVI